MDIRLADNGDIDLTDGVLSLTTGREAVAQRLRQAISMFFGEWFLDKTRGIPYVQQVFVKNPNPVVIDTVFKRTILEEPAVTKLREFTLDLDTATRELSVDFRVSTTSGDIDFSEIVSP